MMRRYHRIIINLLNGTKLSCRIRGGGRPYLRRPCPIILFIKEAAKQWRGMSEEFAARRKATQVEMAARHLDGILLFRVIYVMINLSSLWHN